LGKGEGGNTGATLLIPFYQRSGKEGKKDLRKKKRTEEGQITTHVAALLLRFIDDHYLALRVKKKKETLKKTKRKGRSRADHI